MFLCPYISLGGPGKSEIQTVWQPRQRLMQRAGQASRPDAQAGRIFSLGLEAEFLLQETSIWLLKLQLIDEAYPAARVIT
jgi:hypothetical protein